MTDNQRTTFIYWLERLNNEMDKEQERAEKHEKAGNTEKQEKAIVRMNNKCSEMSGMIKALEILDINVRWHYDKETGAETPYLEPIKHME